MNNNILASECSSGCESGWTLYLEHSLLSPYPSHGGNEFAGGRTVYSEEKRAPKDEDEEEEDLSMVSDASSGPPIFHEDEFNGNADNGSFYHAAIDDPTLLKNSGKRKKTKENRRRKVEEHPSFLDDTASSPIFNFSQNNFTLTNHQASMENILDFSPGCSATHFNGRSALLEPLGFFQSSLSGNQLQRNQWFGGKMGMR